MASPRLDGIDTSHYQRLSGAQFPQLVFAMHKASEGRSYRDRTLPEFIAAYRASARVQHVGFYHFLRSDSPAAAQATNFIDAINSVGGLKPGEFWCCDWERDSAGQCATVAEVTEFCRLVSAAFGASCGSVYSAPWVPGFDVWRSRNPHVALFLANYRTSSWLPNNGWTVSARTGAVVWQFTGKGSTPGIVGACDQNMVMQPAWFAQLTAPIGTVPPPPRRNLHKGLAGEDVRWVQQFYRDRLAYRITVDGKFGDETADFTRWFQGSHDLVVSGWVNQATWAKIIEMAGQ